MSATDPAVQMACQSNLPCNQAIFRMFSALLSTISMPCLGQCLNLGRGSKDKDCRHCCATGTYRRSRLAPCMQTVESYVRTQSPSVKEGCCALDPSSPQSSYGSSPPAPHPTVLRTARAAF